MPASIFAEHASEALRTAAPERHELLLGANHLETALAPIVIHATAHLQRHPETRDVLLKHVSNNAVQVASSPIALPLSPKPEQWTSELDALLAKASPERHNLLAKSGALPEMLESLIESALGEISHLDPTSPIFVEAFSGCCESLITAATALEPPANPQSELSNNPDHWADEIRQQFKIASPEAFALADAKGRVEANLPGFVSDARTAWDLLIAENASTHDRDALKADLMTRVDELGRSTVRLAPVTPASVSTTFEMIRRTNAQAAALKGKTPTFHLFGPARSGTTIIGAALSTSPQILVLNDTMVLTRYFSMAFMQKQICEIAAAQSMDGELLPALPETFDAPADLAHVKWLLSLLVTTYYGAGTTPGEPNKNLARFAVHGELLEVDRVIAEARRGATWRDIFGLIYASLTPPEFASAPVLGEKTPDNVKFQKSLADADPDTKFICVVRQPRHNIASIYRRYPVQDMDQVIKHYLEYATPALELDPARTHWIRYEDFVQNPQVEIDNLATFLETDRWTLPDRISAYNMPEYTGTGIDADRQNAIEAMGESETAAIDRATVAFRARFYPSPQSSR